MSRRSDAHRLLADRMRHDCGDALSRYVRWHTAADGHAILVRPLLATDREQLAARYHELSPESRRARFGSPPDELSPRELDRLLDLDYDGRFALAAFVLDDGEERGVGVARYARRNDNPAVAEVAVVVLDAYQHRGIGTLLLRDLLDVARDHRITSFTATVQWTSAALLDAIRAAGATVNPGEPGVAVVAFALGGERQSDCA